MANVKIAVIYYSATGTNHQLALAAVEGAKEVGADVRLRRVKELAPKEAMATNPAWMSHHEATRETVAEATLDDLDWADGMVFSVPTRFGGRNKVSKHLNRGWQRHRRHHMECCDRFPDKNRD